MDYEYHPYNKILEHLYLGNKEASEKYGYQFQLVVNCTPDIKFHKDCKFCIRLPVNDLPEESKKLLKLIEDTHVLEHIHASILAKKDVLVHCYAGAQRSCATVACYLMKYHGVNPNEAINYIKSRRNVAFFGNVNFRDTINEYYNKLH
jgi:protein-tyrosine phosphatase